MMRSHGFVVLVALLGCASRGPEGPPGPRGEPGPPAHDRRMAKENLQYLTAEATAQPGQESVAFVVCGTAADLLVSGACQTTRAFGPYELTEFGPTDFNDKNKPASWTCKVRVPQTSSGPVTVRATAVCLRPP
ncbi:MAG TPA: hypothetical protein VFB62_25965 [Polyangiaceae bacterium]|jgi:hypothetical protein|nr:hypothetical protein [Polyangiaceae bacterium]